MKNLFQGREDGEERQKPDASERMFIVICFASAVVALGIFVLLINGYVNKHYSKYEVVRQVDRQDTNTEQYLCYGGRLIKYSKDGISQITIGGKTVWTGSYDMSDPAVSCCGKYTLAADIGGKYAYIYNGEDTGTEIAVDYEIQQACVSEQGLVALLLEDTTSNTINIYNPYDVSSSLLVEIPTNVEDGYPLCIALSPDGTSLVASYICVTSGKQESRVAFYNFTDVGKNSEYLVGAKNYEGTLVSDVRFLSNSQVCLLADDGFYIWKNMKQPEQVQQKKIKKQIQSVFYNKKFIGLILENADKKKPHQMQIYNLSGSRVADFGFSYSYDQVQMARKEILLYSAKECMIFRTNGVERFHCTVNEGVNGFYPSSRRNRYYLINDSRIQEIKLVNR